MLEHGIHNFNTLLREKFTLGKSKGIKKFITIRNYHDFSIITN